MQRAVAGRQAILDAGAFDQEWYEAQAGTRFESIEKACWHYVWTGRRAGMSPHPLFEPSSAMPKTYRSAGIDPLVTNLAGGPLRGARVHPALPESWGLRDPATKAPHWLTWAKQAGPDSIIPSILADPEPVTWLEFREGALDAARRCRGSQQRRAAPVLTDEAPHYATTTASPHRIAKLTAAAPDGAPRVSVIMPTWNRAGMIRRAVESVQAQTLTDWELIVVDDGSDDDTLLVLEGLTEFEPRLRVIEAPHGGVCKARNRGLDAARGTYVAFLDTDNTWTPEFLEQSVDFAAAEGLPWVHAALQVESKVIHTRYRTFEGSREQLLHGNYIDMNVLIAERAVLESIGGFDESLRRAVDYDLILRLSEVSPPRLVPVIGAIYQDNSDDPNRISVAEPMAWNYFVSLKHLVDFDAQRDRRRVAGRVSIVIPVRDRAQEIVDLVADLRDRDRDLEVILVVSGAGIQTARTLMVAAGGSLNVTVLYRPTEFGWAASVDLGASHATGEFLVLWRVNCAPRGDWWPGLQSALEQPDVGIVQALALQKDGLISSAGAVFVGHDPFPSPLLAGFPREDAAALVCSTVPAPYESVIALRADTFWAVAGVDAILANEFGEVDLSLRVLEAGLGRTVVTNASTVTSKAARGGFTANPSASVRQLRQRYPAPAGSAEVWQRVDFEQTGRTVVTLDAAGDTPEEQGAQPVIRPRVSESPGRLRWALDVAAVKNEPALWRFAQDLAAAMRDAGQQVHVDSHRARDSAHRDFDDVTLVLRGPEAIRPRPGGVSMMWILSDPETVTGAECAAQDRVFAASTSWSETSSKRWGLQVEPLLQCVDPSLFRPDKAALAAKPSARAKPRLVFVGDSGTVLRPSVKCAVDAGLNPQIYGLGWHGLIGDELIAGVHLPEGELHRVFGAASAVLTDHTLDLRHEGFLSQQVFEVLASGGRLLCDDVTGLADQFGDAVAVFGSAPDLRQLFAGDWRRHWPEADKRLALAEQVGREHSFAARAETLVAAALSVTARTP